MNFETTENQMSDDQIRYRINVCRELNPWSLGTENNSSYTWGFLAGARNELITSYQKSDYVFCEAWKDGRSWQKQVFPEYE